MKFLIDAQLPPSLKLLFQKKGFDCVHTIDLPKGNFATDDDLREISLLEERIIISKDNDFYESFILKNIPPKLILVKTGNCTRQELLSIFESKFEEIIKAITVENLVLLTKQ
jgi:predicted nuclease of predicted toxin-antitoxin system